MSAWRPLSTRGQAETRFDGLHEGLPTWLEEPVLGWVRPLFRDYHINTADRLRTLQNVLRLDPPLDWRSDTQSAYPSLLNRMHSDPEFTLDVLDFLLHFIADSDEAQKLDTLLAIGGSAWEVTPAPREGARSQLTRRAVGPVAESIDAIRTPSQRAHGHLTAAWSALMGRNPSASTAYREAIRAVEAAAKPVVTPKDSTATLGKIIAALRAKPEKWTVILDGVSAERVADVADMIWRAQFDRHGTDDATVPLNVSHDEADAAVHIALALVRLFVSGAIRAA